MSVLAELLEAIVADDGSLQALGERVGKLYTDHGLPIDMALDRIERRLELTKKQKLAVLQGACGWLIEHRRLSGAPEKAIERQRNINFKMIEDFVEHGEVNAY